MWVISQPFRTYDKSLQQLELCLVAIMGVGEILAIITGPVDLSIDSVIGLVAL
jgi:ABC-type xylose transport system permease subunit